MKVIIVDNYDSFTYNIMHYVEQFVNTCSVIKVDEISIDELKIFDRIILSPGPGLPKDRPFLQEIIDTYKGKKPILGICFGHQAIAEYFGGTLINMPQVHHGVARDMLIINQSKLFNSMPKRLKSGRYHSWAVEHASFPDELDILACDEELNTIMAFEHKQFHITGIQFHPESVLTEYGLKMIENWIHS